MTSVRKTLEQTVLSDFIEIYKNSPCLWKTKCEQYHNRDLKNAAYIKLGKKLSEIEPAVKKESVLRKINTLRSNIRREKKKIDASRKSGASTDDLYTPSLWYYDLFDFLGDQDTPRSSVSNIPSPERDNDEENIDDPPLEEIQPPPMTRQDLPATLTTGNQRPGPNKKRKSNDDLSTDILTSVRDHFKAPKPQVDCCELLGQTVAIKMRGIKDKRLHLIYEKKISDILFEMEMSTLQAPNSTPSPHEHYTPSSTPQVPQIYMPSSTPSPHEHYSPNTQLYTSSSSSDSTANYFANFSFDCSNQTQESSFDD